MAEGWCPCALWMGQRGGAQHGDVQSQDRAPRASGPVPDGTPSGHPHPRQGWAGTTGWGGSHMQPQALVNQAAPSDLHSPFPVWRRASRWHGGVARPEGAVRCKGSGHGQPRAGSPSLLGCVVATEVVTGTRSPPPPPPPPTSPAGVVDQGWSQGTATPSGRIQSIRELQAALEATSLGESPGRPIVPISAGGQPYQYSPPGGSGKNPGARLSENTHTLLQIRNITIQNQNEPHFPSKLP